MIPEQIAVMAQSLMQQFTANPSITTAQADVLAQPLIDALTEQLGLQASHVEWAGLIEHGVIPIFDYHEVTDKIFAYNVNLDGTIDDFGEMN